MIDPREIAVVNRLLYAVCAVAVIVMYLDLFVWRP